MNWGLQLFRIRAPRAPWQAASPFRWARARGGDRGRHRARTSPNGDVIAGGNAPIRGAENGATAYLAGLTDAGRKFILLATAGAPSCLPGEQRPRRGDAAGSVQAITTRERGLSDHRPRHRGGRRDRPR